MSLFHRICGNLINSSFLAVLLFSGVALGQDFSSMGITDVVASADRMLQRGDYRGAIPALKEVISRTASLTDPQGMDTAQTCRFQLARSYYQVGDVPEGMSFLEDYLDNKPLKKERLALRMMAQGFFDTQEWGKIEKLSERLLALPDLEKEDIYNANLLLGQARFRQEKWSESVEPLSYAARYAKDSRVQKLCQVMSVRALVEAKEWSSLFNKLPGIYRTDSKYDISLNLTLMKAGKALFEEENYLNALLLYRWVLPREELVAFSSENMTTLIKKLQADQKRGIPPSEIEERESEISDLKESVSTLEELPAYEDEVSFRIGQIYVEVKRYWEAFVLFDRLYEEGPAEEIGEAAMLQSVLILYDVGQVDRAEKRILSYLDSRPDGQYARTQLSMMIRDNLVKQNFERVIELQAYLDKLPGTDVSSEVALQSDLHYMTAFGYFQNNDYKSAGEQFGVIIEKYKDSSHYGDSVYYAGMTHMLQGHYSDALASFKAYQDGNKNGEHIAAALFREAVCNLGLEKVPEAEAAFTKFIESYVNDSLISEAYSMRGDIEAAKEATNEDPYTLDRALVDYRKGIDKATTTEQASYAAFQAAKVYKLEFKWQEIVDLMNYYIGEWKEQANVAEAVFWIGQAQIELGEVDAAVSAYLDAIQRFGNDPSQKGVDKVIHELVKIAGFHLSDEDREGLALKLKLKLTSIDPEATVLRLRLQITQAMLQGEDIAAAFGAELLESNTELSITTPASLSLMCDAAVSTGNAVEMQRLSEYFIATYEESDLLWHAYRAKTEKLQLEDDHWAVLAAVDESQGLFGAEPHMGWAQIIKANTQYKMEKYQDAEDSYNMIMGIPEWRGPLYAEAMYGMGKCRQGREDLEAAHSFYQRTYLLFKSYAEGEWAAKGYLAAADILIKLGRQEEAVRTLREMLEDPYTNKNPMAEQVREQLKRFGGE